MHVTYFYAALFGLLFVALSIRTLRLRVKSGISIGDAGNQQLLRAIRVHSNFAEYVPMALLLIYFTEIQGASARFLHGVCLCLLIGRLLHAYGVSQVNENPRWRIIGTALTLGTIVVAATMLLLKSCAHAVAVDCNVWLGDFASRSVHYFRSDLGHALPLWLLNHSPCL